MSDDLLGQAGIIQAARDEVMAIMEQVLGEHESPAALASLYLACAVEAYAALNGMENVPGMLRSAADGVEAANGHIH